MTQYPQGHVPHGFQGQDLDAGLFVSGSFSLVDKR